MTDLAVILSLCRKECINYHTTHEVLIIGGGSTGTRALVVVGIVAFVMVLEWRTVYWVILSVLPSSK